MKARIRTASRQPLRVATRADLSAPGFYQVDVAIRDKRSGSLGRATAFSSLPDLEQDKGILLASPITLKPDVPRRVLPSTVFAMGTPIRVGSTIAHATSRSRDVVDLSVAIRISREGSPVASLEPYRVTKAVDGLVTFEAPIPTADLEPGDYIVELILTDLAQERKPVLTVETAFRIESR